MADLGTNESLQRQIADILGHVRSCARWSHPARKTNVSCNCIAWQRAGAALLAADDPLKVAGQKAA